MHADTHDPSTVTSIRSLRGDVILARQNLDGVDLEIAVEVT